MKEGWVPMAGGGFKYLFFFNFHLWGTWAKRWFLFYIFSKRVEITARCTVHMKGNQKSSFWNARNLRNNYIPESSTGLQFEPLSHQQQTWGWNLTPLEGLGTHKNYSFYKETGSLTWGFSQLFTRGFFRSFLTKAAIRKDLFLKRLDWAPFEFFKPPGPKPTTNHIVEDAFFEQMQGFLHSLWTGRFATGMSMVLSN